MSQCPKCGGEVRDGASFCTNCGTKLEAPSPAQTFCVKCGRPLNPGAKFCVGCGTPVGTAPTPKQPSAGDTVNAAPVDTPTAPPTAAPTPKPQDEAPTGPENTKPAKKRMSPMVIVLPVLAVLIVLGGLFGWRWYSQKTQASELLESATEYLSTGGYKQAEEAFLELAELQPDNADVVIGLAKACLYQKKFDDAARYLKELDLSESDSQYEECRRLLSVAQFKPEVAKINTDNFPRIDITLNCQGDLRPEQGEITVTEDGTDYELSGYTSENGTFTLSYMAPDTENSDEKRRVSVSMDLDGFVFTRDGSYHTPRFEQARVTLTSVDVSRYPTVTAYFRVEDPNSGEVVEGLDASSFRISESLQGGEYLSREVHSAQPLEGNQGLSIDLVADKSSSISDYDMRKIKSVMIDFVNSLHYGDGDKAEVLAFDSIVQQMCYYTNDVTLLTNGINNMSTDGRTALYNAIYDGIHNAALQGGARCVIAFTDGMDNESWYTPNEIVRYANESQVPVYIIGVGSGVEEYALRTVAEGTGGRYWFIDDLYDLQQIFNEIYSEQKKLYAVEYVSSESADAYDPRNLSVSISGSGYRAQEEMSFQAVHSVSGQTHASRYEVVTGALSWEDAARRCQEMGGHLATITSQSEMDQIVSMAESADLKYVWLGGYTSYDSAGNVFGHWVTGESFSYQNWSTGEPSRRDLDGVDEWYIMLWNVPSLGGWTWNDQRNDPAAAVPSMAKNMGFICEYEN